MRTLLPDLNIEVTLAGRDAYGWRQYVHDGQVSPWFRDGTELRAWLNVKLDWQI